MKYSIRKLKPEKFLTDSVGSIIFSLCEAARIEPCFNAGVKINSEYSSKYEINKSKEIVDESKKIDFNGYVSDYVQCYKFIYGKKPKELQSVTERKVLTRDDFELFKNICLFVKNGFQKDEKKQSFVTKLINCHDIEDMKNMDCVKNKKHQLSEIARDKNTVDKVVSFIIECSGINFTLEEINEIKKQYEIISEHRKCVNQKHSETPAKKQKRAGNRVFINN